MSLLADVMTHRGHLMAITRHGINQQETGPFQRASFEQTSDVLVDACQFGESNDLRGVTERIMLGMVAEVGTGSFDLVLDLQALKTAMEVPQFIGGNFAHEGVVDYAALRSPHQFMEAKTPHFRPVR